MGPSAAGYKELEHTADWALKVWASDIAALFEQAAIGMNALANIEMAQEPLISRKLNLYAPDRESLLVAFLAELLHFAESERIAFRHFFLEIEGTRINAVLEGSTILKVAKEIKAVTFHNLAIKETAHGLETQIVFDV
jgi:SHS2 domain-containing protein